MAKASESWPSHKVSNINACLYCSAHQVKVMLSQSVPQEKIDNMHAYETYPAFTEKERAMLVYAEALTIDASNIPAEVYHRLSEHLSDQEKVEVTIVASAMGMLNRLNDGLRVPIETPLHDIARTITFENR